MENKVILADLFYLPPIEFFVVVQDFDELRLEAHDNYQKQTYRNRSLVRLANKVETLSIPVVGGNKKVKYSKIKIDYHQKWKNVHLRGIKSAYGKAPFFEYFFPYFEDVFQKEVDNLFDFNLELLTLCLKLLKFKTRITLTSNYTNKPTGVDLRSKIVAKEAFESREIYYPSPYHQLFGSDFVPNLSIIDLLFCEGPLAKEVIARSKKNN
ncbi:WbqC family protein [Echinicola sp. CAU 1574]|uniref:WbqC family protein n=1 Tax=Echinicola arenosa TaxID=2774144 RepID=A0ABR9AII9_9BACT|nr:WbqC family protein [Echinicola arenosa]MBD8488132.1 WbqC family protein [Echinicola arenosa]